MDTQILIDIIKEHFPMVQAIYMFGTYGSEYERPDSDLDIALLLPIGISAGLKSLTSSKCRTDLEIFSQKTVDLINLRQVSTVFQNEIVTFGKKIYCCDIFAADEFEMLSLSYYQKLNEERRYILKEIMETGRVLKL